MYFTKDSMCSEYGLSCFENYVLYLLNTNTEHWEKVYYKSYCSYDTILYQLAVRGQSYSSIDFLERLQTTAEQLGLIETRAIDAQEFDYMRPGSLLIVQITPEAVKDLFDATLWRDDHLILVYKKNVREYEYLNDHPLRTGVLSSEELADVSGNTGFAVKITVHPGSVGEEKELLRKLRERISSEAADIREQDTVELSVLRDSIGIFRVVVRRMGIFLACCCGQEPFGELCQELDLLYSKTEYLRIRNNGDVRQTKDILRSVRAIDLLFTRQLDERIKRYHDKL